MDDADARLAEAVADAAEAWLADPRDTGVYGRLVAAVAERRAHRAAVRCGPVGPGPMTSGDAVTEDEPDDEPAVPLRPVGADLAGDPRAVLDRLRRG